MKNSVGRFIAGRVSTILDNSISPSTLRFYSSHSPPSSSSKLFVAGLSWSVDEKSLKDAFSSFGNVSEVRIMYDTETGRSRGFGFVHFSNENEAMSAKDGIVRSTIKGKFCA
ncbi:hypothetical protein V6Z12_A08G014700 [Gossypium hirsutum]